MKLPVLLSALALLASASFADAQDRPRLVPQRGLADTDIYQAALSPDGSTVLTAEFEVRLWDRESGFEIASTGEVAPPEGMGTVGVTAAAFSSDGRYHLGSTRTGTWIWDIASNTEIARVDAYVTGEIALSPDGRRLVAWDWGFMGGFTAYDVLTGDSISVGFRPPPGLGHGVQRALSADATCAAFAHEGLHVYDVSSGDLRRLIDADATSGVALSADCSFALAVDAAGVARVYEVSLGRVVSTLEVWTDDLGGREGFGISADGRYLLHSGHLPNIGGRVQVYDLTANQAVVLGSGSLATLVLSTDGSHALSHTQEDLSVIDFRSGTTTAIPLDHVGLAIGDEPERSDSDLALLEAIGIEEVVPTIADLFDPSGPALSADGAFMISAVDDRMYVVDTKNGSAYLTTGIRSREGYYPWWSEGGGTIAWLKPDGQVWLWSAGRSPIRVDTTVAQVFRLAVSGDGARLAVLTSQPDVLLIDALTGAVLDTSRFDVDVTNQYEFFGINGDGSVVVSELGIGRCCPFVLWDIVNDREIDVDMNRSEFNARSFGEHDTRVAVQSGQSNIPGVSVYDVSTGVELWRLDGSVAMSDGWMVGREGKHLASVDRDGITRIWDIEADRELATVMGFTDGSWLVTTPDGRFDAPDLERISGAVWVAPDDPLTPLSIEAFMRDFYEPRLLSRVLAGEAFPEIGSILEKNRVQPEVEIAELTLAPEASGKDAASGGGAASGERRLARVTVRARGTERTYADSTRASGVRDVRLFRGGQLVGWADGLLVPETGAWDSTFTVPLASAADTVAFSAYAFNRDLVKSRTAYVDLAVPPEARPRRRRRAFIVSLGVDRFDDLRWDLLFAAADARAYHAALDSTLTASGEYDAVVAVELVSDHDPARSTDATAAALRGALLRLAGDPLDADAEAALAKVPGAEYLSEATPDDVVIVTASTHGYASPEGVFYLLPSDVPIVTGGPALGDAAFLEALVSSDELSLWLRGVDAGTLAVVVDACNAAGAVEGNDFKPGPMGARGLGQLAFDKGAAVLTATQADAPALEASSTERGLLTFALVENGLLAGQADGAGDGASDGRITLEEWLAYGVARVPGLHAEVASDSVSTYGRGGGVRVRSLPPELAGPELADGEEASGAQTPALFDFRKGARQTTLAARPRAEE